MSVHTLPGAPIQDVHLEPMGDRETRFPFRVRANLEPAWLRALYHLEIVFADFG